MAKHKKLSDSIRDAIAARTDSRASLAKATGISESMVSRFMGGKMGLSTDRLDALAEFLDLEVVARKRTVKSGIPRK